MAYDASDPADVAIVTAAVTAERERLQSEHETTVDRLEGENAGYRARIRELRANGGDANTAGEIERLENELRENTAARRTAEASLRQATRDLETRTTERDAAVTDLNSEREYSRNALVNSSLTAELTAANVAPHFIDDLVGSMSRGATIREVDGERRAFHGDKPLADYVKEWATGDKGKHYVLAPGNGGSGTKPGEAPGSNTKKISEMNTFERNAHFTAVGEKAFNEQAAAERSAPKS